MEAGTIPTFKNELIRAVVYLLRTGSLRETISISLNDDSNQNLLRICDVYLRQRAWGRTGRFAIAAGGIRISSWNDHPVGY